MAGAEESSSIVRYKNVCGFSMKFSSCPYQLNQIHSFVRQKKVFQFITKIWVGRRTTEENGSSRNSVQRGFGLSKISNTLAHPRSKTWPSLLLKATKDVVVELDHLNRLPHVAFQLQQFSDRDSRPQAHGTPCPNCDRIHQRAGLI